LDISIAERDATGRGGVGVPCRAVGVLGSVSLLARGICVIDCGAESVGGRAESGTIRGTGCCCTGNPFQEGEEEDRLKGMGSGGACAIEAEVAVAVAGRDGCEIERDAIDRVVPAVHVSVPVSGSTSLLGCSELSV
jgi:hypothetical protein